MLIIQFAAVAIIVALDQLVKLWTVNNLEMHRGFPVIENIFDIYRTSNTGAAWSILEGQTWLLVLVSAVASIAMVYILASRKIKSNVGNWAIALVLAGALGNLIDRIFRGGEVVDMFCFRFIDFPVFNVADIAVTFGAILLFIFLIFIYDDKSEKKKQ